MCLPQLPRWPPVSSMVKLSNVGPPYGAFSRQKLTAVSNKTAIRNDHLVSDIPGTSPLSPASIHVWGETNMGIRWGAFSTKSRKALKTGWLIMAGVIALYLGVIQPRDRARGIASERSTGLAAVSGDVGWQPISLWRQTSILPHLSHEAYLQKGTVGGVPVDRAVLRASLMLTPGNSSSGEGEASSPDRKLVRTASLG
jgi:hypothetical protein